VRRAAPITLLLVAATLGRPLAARADDPTPEAIAAVERAFLEGRITDAAALISRDEFPVPAGAPDAERLTERMFGWRDGRGDAWRDNLPLASGVLGFGTPRGPPLARYPLVIALLSERDIREAEGMRGLPERSPLTAFADPDGRIAHAQALQRSLYRRVADEDSSDPEIAVPARRRIARAHERMGRATVWAAVALGVLVGLTALAAFLVRRVPERP
jgi:hypothetical protein